MNITEQVNEQVYGNVMEVELQGKLTQADYERLIPETEKLIRQYGKIRILVIMHDFHGWDAKAAWEDIRWNSEHLGQVERLAIVGEETIEGVETAGAFDIQFSRSAHWHRWITALIRPFTRAQVRHFPLYQLNLARTWINESDYARFGTLPRSANMPDHTSNPIRSTSKKPLDHTLSSQTRLLR